MNTTIDNLIINNIGSIDDSLIDEAINVRHHLATRRKIKRTVISTVCGAAACFLCIFGLVTFMELSSGDNANLPKVPIDANKPSGSNGSNYIPEFTGLPIAEPCPDKHEEFDGVYVRESRSWMPKTLLDFFNNDYQPHAFAFVRVIETNQWENKQKSEYYTDIYDMQTSTLQILSVIRSDREIPEIISIDQSSLISFIDNRSGEKRENLIIKCGCSRPIMFLREGGVYLLPLWKQGSKWHTVDRDVLFEIDDEGLIFSHTWLPGFNKYDGRPASQLAQAISSITEDEDFELAASRFADFVSEIWNVILDVTVLPETSGQDVVAAIENILVRPDKTQVDKLLEFYAQNDEYYEERNYNYIWQWENGSVIEAQAYTTWLFEPGNRYLVIFYLFDDVPYINSLSAVARVNADGTISPHNNVTDGWFAGVENYTIEQITDIARRLTEFFEKY